MSPRCIVLIAAPDLMPKLKERSAEPGGELLTFSDTDALRALEAILKRKPNVVALEQRFSSTPRGTALINRIKADPTLTQAEIRVLSQDGAQSVVSSPQTATAAAAPTPAPAGAAPAGAASAGAAPAKPTPAKPTNAPVGDVWTNTQPRRVDMPPAASSGTAPAPPKVAPPAPAPAKPVPTPAAAAKPTETRPPAPAAEAVIDDRRLAAEAPVESFDLAVESDSAAIEFPADWIEETADTKAADAGTVDGPAPDEYEVLTNAGDVVALDLPVDEPPETTKTIEPPRGVAETKPGAPAPPQAAASAKPVAAAPPILAPAKHDHAAGPAAPSPAGAQPLDQTGTRRAPRFKIDDAAALLLDGNTAKLVDLSSNGAQVLSGAILKPNQRVRIALTDKQGSVKISGSVAWALFEIPPRYRAGIAFLDADPTAVDTFCARHKKQS